MNKNDLVHATLVPIDFSESSLFALEHASQVTQLEEKRHLVTLLHVIEGSNFLPITSASEVKPNQKNALAIEGAIVRLEKIIAGKTNPNVDYKFIVAGGKVYKKIIEIAEDIEADFIVMGTHGASGLGPFAGSNATKVIHTSPCPVIIVKEQSQGAGYKNIVLPLDLTKETKHKVAIAARMAEHFKATIHIITFSESDEWLRNKLENNLHQVERYMKDRGIETTTNELTDASGSFASRTLDWAHGKNADLIIIMSDTGFGITEYLFGTYAQQIVNRSPVPVMAVTPRQELLGDIDISVGDGF